MNEFHTLWKIHEQAQWPDSLGQAEGELMMVDTVIVGCINYYLEEHELDPQRVVILEDSIADLEALLPDVPEEGSEYFGRLQKLGALLLQESSHHSAS